MPMKTQKIEDNRETGLALLESSQNKVRLRVGPRVRLSIAQSSWGAPQSARPQSRWAALVCWLALDQAEVVASRHCARANTLPAAHWPASLFRL